MKKLIATAAIAIVTLVSASASSANSSASSANSANSSASSANSSASSANTSATTLKEKASRKIDANNIHTSSKAFGVGMYQITGTESIKLLVETTQKLSVKITDEKGNVLNREALKSSGAMTINLSDVPSGEYFVEVSNGTETITRQITKTTGSLSAE